MYVWLSNFEQSTCVSPQHRLSKPLQEDVENEGIARLVRSIFRNETSSRVRIDCAITLHFREILMLCENDVVSDSEVQKRALEVLANCLCGPTQKVRNDTHSSFRRASQRDTSHSFHGDPWSPIPGGGNAMPPFPQRRMWHSIKLSLSKHTQV